MTFRRKINAKTRTLASLMVTTGHNSYKKVGKILKMSASSVHRCCKEGVEKGRRKRNGRLGRPKIISKRDSAHCIRPFEKLQDNGQNPTVKHVMMESSISRGSYRSYVRVMNIAEYETFLPRRKRMLSRNDKKLRKVFAKHSLPQYDNSCWRDDASFYVAAVSFVHKYNPHREATKPIGKIWRRRSEGLECTTTGSKDLPEGKRVGVLVAMSYHTGVILAEPYDRMSGSFFAEFVRSWLPRAFIDERMKSRQNRMKRLFVMDSDPCQNSKIAKAALANIGANILKIPPRSPDLNPIENIFHNVERTLLEEALREKITYEPYTALSVRILRTQLLVNKYPIKKTINTMPKRLKCIVETNGNSTRY